MTNSYSNNLGLLTMKKQSQSNPTCGEQGRTIYSLFIRVNSPLGVPRTWLNSKQTQLVSPKPWRRRNKANFMRGIACASRLRRFY
jgi:hypothetical protein